MAFWTAHAAGAGSWVAGSSLISVGLEPLSAWLCIATAHILITMLIVINGRGPARYHIGVSRKFCAFCNVGDVRESLTRRYSSTVPGVFTLCLWHVGLLHGDCYASSRLHHLERHEFLLVRKLLIVTAELVRFDDLHSGGRCVTVAITAIWPQYGTMENSLPASASITSQDLISCVLSEHALHFEPGH